ncbi:MAG: HlyD family efflux transporter periplasmic adaptor subunit, partial [Actinomycetes bacterium]
VGQRVNVVASGSDQVLTGSVVAIGAAPTTSGTTVAYPVTVSLTGQSPDLRPGASATVEIVTAAVDNALSVPTSAVHTARGFKLVTVLAADGTLSAKQVTIGAVGPTYTQVLTGLAEGDSVVLANLDDPVPSSNSTNTRGFGGPGGLGGTGGSGRPGAATANR